jgi:hypothetical protein
MGTRFGVTLLTRAQAAAAAAVHAVRSSAASVHGQEPDGLPDDRIGVACVCIVRMQAPRCTPW